VSEDKVRSELRVRFLAPAISTKDRDQFAATARLCHAVLARIAEECGLPTLTEVIVTDDFEQTVRTHMRRDAGQEAEPFFVADRPGGSRVSAKTLPQDERYDHAIIVFDGRDWSASAGAAGAERLRMVALIGHELSHTVLERVALASGVTKDVIYPSYTPGEIARSLSRMINHEYRADWMSEIIVAATCSTDRDGQPVPIHSWDVFSSLYLDLLRDTFVEAYADGPGAVQDYRTWQIDLQTMFTRVVQLTESVLVNYIHARALADSVGQVPLLEDSELSALPFVRLYLADTLPPVVRVLQQAPLLMSPQEWKEFDGRLVLEGERAIREIWRRLGLTFEENARESYRISVVAPIVT
jgi:hypothetical protein